MSTDPSDRKSAPSRSTVRRPKTRGEGGRKKSLLGWAVGAALLASVTAASAESTTRGSSWLKLPDLTLPATDFADLRGKASSYFDQLSSAAGQVVSSFTSQSAPKPDGTSQGAVPAAEQLFPGTDQTAPPFAYQSRPLDDGMGGKASSWLSRLSSAAAQAKSSFKSQSGQLFDDVGNTASSLYDQVGSAGEAAKHWAARSVDDMGSKANDVLEEASRWSAPIITRFGDEAASLLNAVSSTAEADKLRNPVKTSDLTIRSWGYIIGLDFENEPLTTHAHTSLTTGQKKHFLQRGLVPYRGKEKMRLCEINPTTENTSERDVAWLPGFSLPIVSSTSPMTWASRIGSWLNPSQTIPRLVMCTNSRSVPVQDDFYWRAQFLDPNGEKSATKSPSIFGPYTTALDIESSW